MLDDPSRENEADLIVAARHVTPEQMAFMIHHSSGLVCAPISSARADALDLPPMVAANQDPRGTAYTVTVDADHPSLTTGISAADRALTCRALADPTAGPASLRRPGHVLPLRSVPGGVRARPGHTEAATEFCRLAGFDVEAAAICEIVDPGDEVPARALRRCPGMLRGEACVRFARKWGLKVCTIADLKAHVEAAAADEKKALGSNGST